MRKFLIVLFGIAATVLVLVYATGCGTQASADKPSLSQDQYASIEVGMSTDQLKIIAGEPARTEAKSMSGGHSMGGGSMTGGSMNMEYWYYQGTKGWLRFEVADNKVTSKSGY